MGPVKSGPTDWEMEFLGELLADLPEDHLPTVGELFRYFYHHRQALPHNARNSQPAQLAVTRCIEIWEKFGIPTGRYYNLTRIFLRLLKTFKAVPYNKRENSFARWKKEVLWPRKLNSVFNVAAYDAMDKCSRKNRKLLQAIEKEAEELDNAEKNLSRKKKLEDDEVSTKMETPRRHVGVKDDEVNTMMETPRRHVGAKRKAKGKENAEPATKKCKVMLSRVGDSADLDDELERQSIDKPQKVSSALDNLGSGSTSIDVQPDDEDIVPPNLPTVIIKQEIDIEWDENDNKPTYYTNYDEYNHEDYSLEKDSMLSDKLGLHSFIENDEGRFII